MANLAPFKGAAIKPSGGFLIAAPAATIEVRRKDTGALAAIYSDEAGTAPITNPSAFADANGNFIFYAAGLERGYIVTVTDGAFTLAVHIMLGTAGQFDATAFTGTFLDDAAAPAARLTLGFPAIVAKGDVFSGSAADTMVKTAVGSNGQVAHADSSQTGGLVYIDNPSRPNLLINPNWQIDQINEGALYTVNAVDVRGPDGWSGTSVGAGVFKLRTIADPDNAALKCLEITCTTADAAIAATDDYFIYAAIEGYEAAALMAGTASAQPITVQFKFKSNVNGVYGVSIANSALNRRYIGSFTVANANENEYSVSLTMDTAGTWLYTNGVGCYLRICLAAGSNFQATAGAWAAGAEQTTSGQANFMSVNTNVAYLKRIQLIPGALVQAYRPSDIAKELARAQRYYWKTFSQGTAVAQNAGRLGAHEFPQTLGGAQVQRGAQKTFPVVMRTLPSMLSYNPSVANAEIRNVVYPGDWSATGFESVGDSGYSVFGTTPAGTATASQSAVHVTANARLS